jgi:molybdate transport system regulatory protein
VALLVRAVGGVGGGGARLTPAGEQLLDAARQMDGARLNVLQRFSGGAAQALSGTGLRTSMRNHLPCRVTEVQVSEAGDPMARVVLSMAEGGGIASLITLESAELLALQNGMSVLALCKATAVTVCADLLPAREHRNQLSGRVARVSRGSLRDEVVMTLPGDLQLVGFADRPNRLRVGSKVTACVEENAVVLALV